MKVKKYKQRINEGPSKAVIMPTYGEVSYIESKQFDLPRTILRDYGESLGNFMARVSQTFYAIETKIEKKYGGDSHIWLKYGKPTFKTVYHKFDVPHKISGHSKKYKVKRIDLMKESLEYMVNKLKDGTE